MRSAALVVLLLVGCAHTEPAPPAQLCAPPPEDPAAFERGEDEILRDLAAIDRRFAKRAHITPSEGDLERVAMTAILHEDPTVVVNDGAIDPFSFDARGRGLDAVKARLAALPPVGGGGERELLARVVEGEIARLDEERLLPRSASALIHAIVDTWGAPRDPHEMADADRWLARRLGEVRASLAAPVDPNATLDVGRARELDDALDAFEHLATGLVKTTQELLRLREALEGFAHLPPAGAHSDWDLVAKRLRAQVGVTAGPNALATDFNALEADLRARFELALAASDTKRSAISDALEEKLFVSGPCVDALPQSRLRSMLAPAEREPACQLQKAVLGESNDVAIATLHDHLVIAAWALDVARGSGTIAEAESKYHLILLPLPGTRARLERIALARPAMAIGAGVAVKLLVAGNSPVGTVPAIGPAARAKAWQALGDVPFDIAARELH